MRLPVLLLLCMSCATDHATQEAEKQAIMKGRALDLRDFSTHMADALVVADWAELFSHYPRGFRESCSVADYSEVMDAYWNDLRPTRCRPRLARRRLCSRGTALGSR